MRPEPQSERVARMLLWPYGAIWRRLKAVHPLLPYAALAANLVSGAALWWMAEQRPYDLWRQSRAVRTPMEITCYDYWGGSREVADKIQKGEDVRVIALRREQGWIRVARKSGGACWVDHADWPDATLDRGAP